MRDNFNCQCIMVLTLVRKLFLSSKCTVFEKLLITWVSVSRLLRVIEKWENSLDNSGVVGIIVMDVSKASDWLHHGLLIAKLAACGFSISSLSLVYDYPTNGPQSVKIASTKSNPQKILVAGDKCTFRICQQFSI